jgi:hypothetical protein
MEDIVLQMAKELEKRLLNDIENIELNPLTYSIRTLILGLYMR